MKDLYNNHRLCHFDVRRFRQSSDRLAQTGADWRKTSASVGIGHPGRIPFAPVLRLAERLAREPVKSGGFPRCASRNPYSKNRLAEHPRTHQFTHLDWWVKPALVVACRVRVSPRKPIWRNTETGGATGAKSVSAGDTTLTGASLRRSAKVCRQTRRRRSSLPGRTSGFSGPC